MLQLDESSTTKLEGQLKASVTTSRGQIVTSLYGHTLLKQITLPHIQLSWQLAPTLNPSSHASNPADLSNTPSRTIFPHSARPNHMEHAVTTHFARVPVGPILACTIPTIIRRVLHPIASNKCSHLINIHLQNNQLYVHHIVMLDLTKRPKPQQPQGAS